MKFYLGDKMLYPTLGNHESAPVNRSDLSMNMSCMRVGDVQHILKCPIRNEMGVSTHRIQGLENIKFAICIKLLSGVDPENVEGWWLGT